MVFIWFHEASFSSVYFPHFQFRGVVKFFSGRFWDFGHSNRPLDHSNRPLDHSNGALDPSNRPLDHSNRLLDHSNRPLDHSNRVYTTLTGH